jgi:hypothetical protein
MSHDPPDPSDDEKDFESTAEILAYIHKGYTEEQEKLTKDPSSCAFEWFCVVTSDDYDDEWVEEHNEQGLIPHVDPTSADF